MPIEGVTVRQLFVSQKVEAPLEKACAGGDDVLPLDGGPCIEHSIDVRLGKPGEEATWKRCSQSLEG
jgi:hypothetical protein